MPYELVIVDRDDDNEEHDRYDSAVDGDADRAVIDACVRAGHAASSLNDGAIDQAVALVVSGIAYTVSGPHGTWTVRPEYYAA